MRYYMIQSFYPQGIRVRSHGDQSPVPVPNRHADLAGQVPADPDFHKENIGWLLGHFSVVRHDANRILVRVAEDGIFHAWYVENV